MQMDIRNWCGVGSVDRQAGTAPGPQPQRGPPSATGRTIDKETTLNIAHWNAEGIRKKKPELQNFLSKEKIDVLCVQETHLNEQHRFSIRGYQTFRNDRENRIKGGVLTLVKNNIPATEIKKSTANSGTEYITIKVVLPKKEITITNAYCPSDRDIETNVFPTSENTIILGDFNSHSPSWGYDSMDNRGEIIEDWLIENRFILLNKPDDEPTFWSRAWKKTSTPDLCFASENIQKLSSRTVSDQLGGSDHRPVLIKLHDQPTGRSFCKEPSWNFKKANWSKFEKLTETFCKEKPFINSNDIHKNVENFTSGILEAAKQSIPRGRRDNYKPYWSDRMNELHENLSKARDNMDTFSNPESIGLHTRARELYDEEKNKNSQKSWVEKTESLNFERDHGKLWKLTNALNDDHQENYKPTVLKENDQTLTGKKAANKLSEHFKENSNLNIPREKSREIRQKIKSEQRKQEPSECMTASFSMQELNRAILKLKNKKAPGPDGITNEMIKHLSSYAKEYLLEIFNQSWTSGIYPQFWKEAIIIPIPKKGKDKTQCTSYRPISLLSCLGKTMERLVNSRLQYHLEKNCLLNPIQSGYRKNRNTEDQVTLLVQDIENAFQMKMKTIAVFVDLTAAFDKVWKEGLLLKILKKQISGNMYNWIRNYLFQRTARVKIDGYKSSLVKIREGVPQGGVISPTLFIIFIDDITEKLTNHICRALHADDLAVWTASENLATAYVRMQMTLEKLGKWAQEWLVTINKKKTEATIFSLSPKKETVNLTMNGEEIPQQDTPTYLGVKLDKRLTWAAHITNMESKAIKRMAVMKKLSGTKWGANAKILKQVYTGSVRPQLEYGATSWGTASRTNTNKLNKIQNASLRMITGAMKTTPITEMEKTAKLQPLENRRKEKCLVQGEKMKRLSTHPLKTRLEEPTKNRLKRTSPNHIVKEAQKEFETVLPRHDGNTETLIDYEEWNEEEIRIETSIPGVGCKDNHIEAELKNLTLEHLNRLYPTESWTHVYTDGSAENAIKNGGAGVFIRYSNGQCENHSFPTGKNCTNYRAEAHAVLSAAKILNNSENLSGFTVILSDCKSVLQSLQTGEENQTLKEIKRELNILQQKTNLSLQWIPSHCGITGNDKADELSKTGSKMFQENNTINYQESKTIIKSTMKEKWKKQNNIEREDSIDQLSRHDQVLIFRLRTGHCRLLSHLCRLKISHTDECPCNTGTQTPEHVLQFCPNYNLQREETWQGEVGLQEKLYGTAADLQRTTAFIKSTGLTI